MVHQSSLYPLSTFFPLLRKWNMFQTLVLENAVICETLVCWMFSYDHTERFPRVRRTTNCRWSEQPGTILRQTDGSLRFRGRQRKNNGRGSERLLRQSAERNKRPDGARIRQGCR